MLTVTAITEVNKHWHVTKTPRAHYCNLVSSPKAEGGALLTVPKHSTSPLLGFCPITHVCILFFLLQHKVGSVGSAFSSAYRLRGADISHCLRLCTPVTRWSQALTDHLCGPTRDSGRLHTAWQESEKCRAWRLFSTLHTSFFAHHSATWLDLQNLDSGNETLRAPTLCAYLSYSVWLCLLLMEQ